MFEQSPPLQPSPPLHQKKFFIETHFFFDDAKSDDLCIFQKTQDQDVGPDLDVIHIFVDHRVTDQR